MYTHTRGTRSWTYHGRTYYLNLNPTALPSTTTQHHWLLDGQGVAFHGILVGDSFVHAIILVSTTSGYFLSFLRTHTHARYGRIFFQFIGWNLTKTWMFFAMVFHPFVQFWYIGDVIQSTTRSQQISIFSQQAIGDDSSAMVFLFELRVRKTKKHFAQLSFLKQIGQVTHRIGTKHGNILICPRLFLFLAQMQDSSFHVFGYFLSDFKTNRDRLRVQAGQIHQQPTKTTPHVGVDFCCRIVQFGQPFWVEM